MKREVILPTLGELPFDLLEIEREEDGSRYDIKIALDGSASLMSIGKLLWGSQATVWFQTKYPAHGTITEVDGSKNHKYDDVIFRLVVTDIKIESPSSWSHLLDDDPFS